MKRFIVFVFALLILSSSKSFSDVTYESETALKFEGALGKMMNFFGAAKPVKSVDYYKNEMKRSDSFDKKGELSNSQIINMKDELFISIDHQRKQYTQMTFDEWFEMMKSTMEQFGQGEAVDVDDGEEAPEAKVDWDLKVDVKKTGETETIAGRKCEKVILTLDMDAKVTATNDEAGSDPETAKGGMIVTSTQWLFKGGDKAKEEMDDFNLKFAEKLGVMPGQVGFKDMMAQVMESNPQLGEAMDKMKTEGEKLDGFAMKTHTLYETKIDPETAQKMQEERVKQEEDEGLEIPTSVGGLLGGFGKKMVKKKMQKDEEVKERNVLMQSETSVLGMTTSPLDNTLFAAKDGHKLVKRDN